MADSSKIVPGLGKDISDNMTNQVTLADTKASAFLAAILVIATLLVERAPAVSWQQLLYIAALLFLALSAIFCALVIVPRTPNGGNGVLFWNDIQQFDSSTDYLRALHQKDEQAIEANYAHQNFLVSQVLHRKHMWLQRAIVLFMIGATLAVVVYAVA